MGFSGIAPKKPPKTDCDRIESENMKSDEIMARADNIIIKYVEEVMNYANDLMNLVKKMSPYSTEEVEQLIVLAEDLQTENEQLRTKNRTLQRLLTELSETSDSEMPTKLSEKLKEQERLLSSEQEQNRQLKKQLQDTVATAEEDKKASSRKISQLERQLKHDKFDKEQYLRGLESRERELKEGQKALKVAKDDFNSRVQSKAEEIEQDTISDYEARKAKCEAEQARLIEQQQAVAAERREWLSSEKEKIDTEVTRQVTQHKAKLDEQRAQERAEQERQHNDREKELRSKWKLRDTALTAKFVTISGLTVSVGLISGIVAIISTVIAFAHGLLPFIIEDGKEIVNWIRNDWNAIFGQTFVFPNTLLPIIQLALPLIFLIVVGIWAALDFGERKWVVFADKISIIAIGTSVGISAVFGKQLSEILGLNTVMFPIAVYLLYVLIRWLWEIGAVEATFNGIKWLITTPIEWWQGLEPHQKTGNVIIVSVIVIAILVIREWVR